MRKPLKLLLTILVVALLCALAINLISAEEGTPTVKKYTLTYQIGDNMCTNANHDHSAIGTYEAGTEVTVSSTQCSGSLSGGESFLGWFSDDGVFYAKGSKITMNRNTILYIAVGKNIGSAAELQAYLNDTDDGYFWNYARLTADINLNNQNIQGNWGGCAVGVLDLNGHTINSYGRQYASGEQRTGMIFVGKGTINFTSTKPLEGAFFTTRAHGWGDGAQRIWIGKDVKIVSNAPLIRFTHSLSNFSTLPTVRIYGDITAPYIMRSNGLFDVDVHLYETCKITITPNAPHALIYDESSELGFTIANLIIHGGTFTLPEDFKGFVTTVDDEQDDRLTYKINGGTFNRDLSTIIPISLRVKNNGDNTFSILPNPCSKAPEGSNGLHKYVATKIGVNCDTAGTIEYSCIYCTEAGCAGESIDCYCNYEVKREAFGHSFISVLTTDMVNTPQQTSPAVNTKTCTRCGIVESSYEFPDPNSVYITLKLKYERDVNGTMTTFMETIRVPSTKVFGFKQDPAYGDGWTCINSFSITGLTYTFSDGREEKFKQSEVIGIEIPLGTTSIQANLFTKNEVIQEIYLPQSLMVINDGVFSYMPNLSKVTGIQYVQDLIGANAFRQNDAETPKLILDSIEVNAKEVGANSFRNVLATRVIIGDNVRRLKDAFPLDGLTGKYESSNKIMKEIFIYKLNRKYHPTEYPTFYGVQITNIGASVWTDLFETFSSTSALLKRGKVYYDHKYETTTHQPTCLQNGFVANECVQCNQYTVTEIIPNTGITHTWEKASPIPATCSTPGQVRQYCERCDSYKTVAEIAINPNKHDFSTTDPEPTPGACTSTEWEYRRRCAYGCGAWSPNKYSAGDKIVLGHVFSTNPDDVIIVKPTCGNPGQKISVCTRCNLEAIEETPAVGEHSWVRNDSAKVNPTCKENGTEFYRCTVCEATDSKVLEKLSYEAADEKGLHKWAEQVLVEPTVKNTGYKRVYCSICGANRRDAKTQIPKLDGEVFLGFIPLGKMSLTTAWIIFGVVVGVLVAGTGIVLFFILSKKKNKSTGYKYKFNTFKK